MDKFYQVRKPKIEVKTDNNMRSSVIIYKFFDLSILTILMASEQFPDF